jgi:ribosomal protein S18 acetylase RimI-like enzyme
MIPEIDKTMKETSVKLINRYCVERIDHHQQYSFSELFSQYRIFQDENSEKAATHRMGERIFNSEPVLFIVRTNYPESIPVGFIQLNSMSSSINAAKNVIVNDLYVLPDYRKTGIALKLIEAAIKFAIHNKSAFIQLKTLQENRAAQKLFESVGFQRQNSASECNVYSIQFESD